MSDAYHFAQIGAIVRAMPSITDGVERLYGLVRKTPKVFSVVADVLFGLRWEEDVSPIRKAVLQRLERCVPRETTGFYMGIDGLNMPDGKGIELGCSTSWKRGDKSIDYIYQCETYCDDLPLKSLAQYYTWFYRKNKGLEAFNKAGTDSLMVEYPVCLGASALVIAHALNEIPSEKLCGTVEERCFAFGFHDGDMMRLGRATKHGFVCEGRF